MSKWKRIYVELDENNCPMYGRFKVCTTCNKRLGSLAEDDDEHLTYHGYCTTKCASEGGYGNYQW